MQVNPMVRHKRIMSDKLLLFGSELLPYGSSLSNVSFVVELVQSANLIVFCSSGRRKEDGFSHLPDKLFEDNLYLISCSKTIFTCSLGSTRRSLYGKHSKHSLRISS